MKYLILLLTLLLSSPVTANEKYAFLGTYETKPAIFPGFHKPYTDKIKQVIERLTWKLEVKEDEVILKMRDDLTPVVMKYTVEGKYILARETDTDIQKYVPFYVENINTLHGFNQVFFRIK